MASNLLKFINFRVFCDKLGFEIGTHFHKVFSLFPFFNIPITTEVALALHDSFREVQILSVYFTLNYCRLYLSQICCDVVNLGV